MKEHLFQAVEARRTTLTAMADSIFDDPELGFQEFHAQKKLTDYLTQSGFQVETGTADPETTRLVDQLRADAMGPGTPAPARAAPASVFCVNMTPWRAWATPAATICRVPPSLGPPRR